MSESPSARVPLRERLREKLPEILIEAGSVVVALSLALALNGWHERMQERERADTARAAILAELRENRNETVGAQPALKTAVADLTAALDESKPEPHELEVKLKISLLSAAAWHAALATQASQNIDFAWMTRIAKVYELQENYIRAQNVALDQLASIPPDKTASSRQVARSLVPRINALANLAEGLARSYDEVLNGTGG